MFAIWLGIDDVKIRIKSNLDLGQAIDWYILYSKGPRTQPCGTPYCKLIN